MSVKLTNAILFEGFSATYISELHDSQFAQLAAASIRCFGLEKQLTQGHLLASKVATHR